MSCARCGSTDHNVSACPWPVKCINCEHINLKGSPLGKAGFSICATTRQPWVTYSPTAARECKRFGLSTPAVIGQRVAYMEAKRCQQ